MVSNISSALNAYQQALSRIGGNVPVSEPKPTINNEFHNLVKSAVDDAVDLSKTGEEMTLKAIQGKADIQDVVLAVSNAEMALNTVVSVRDTAIKAYNTIMSMPI